VNRERAAGTRHDHELRLDVGANFRAFARTLRLRPTAVQQVDPAHLDVTE
jgi:hypothetical protein